MQVIQSGTQFISSLGTQAAFDNLKLDVPVGDEIKEVSFAEAKKILEKIINLQNI